MYLNMRQCYRDVRWFIISLGICNPPFSNHLCVYMLTYSPKGWDWFFFHMLIFPNKSQTNKQTGSQLVPNDTRKRVFSALPIISYFDLKPCQPLLPSGGIEVAEVKFPSIWKSIAFNLESKVQQHAQGIFGELKAVPCTMLKKWDWFLNGNN